MIHFDLVDEDVDAENIMSLAWEEVWEEICRTRRRTTRVLAEVKTMNHPEIKALGNQIEYWEQLRTKNE